MKKTFAKILMALGLMEKAKAKSLSDEDWKNITESYKKETGRDFYADAKEEDSQKQSAHDRALEMLVASEKEKEDDEECGDENEKEKEEETSEDEEKKEEEEEASDDDPKDEDEDEEDKDDEKKESALVKKVSSVIRLNKKLMSENKKLKNQAMKDNPIDAIEKKKFILNPPHSEKHLFGALGYEVPLYSLEKRWNKIALLGTKPGGREVNTLEADAFFTDYRSFTESLSERMRTLQSRKQLSVGGIQSIDYSDLTDANLGSQFLVRRQDALIARIIALPSVKDIFPTRANVQDGELITNAFFGEFSQTYKSGEVDKGSSVLQPEIAKVHDVMFKHKFESMKWIEREYIGYLNTNGSDPVKWNMIEWLVLNISKVLINEQNERYIFGCRKDAVDGVNLPSNLGSTGIIWRIMSYIEENKVLPFDRAGDSSLQTYTSSTILSVEEAFLEKVNQNVVSLSGAKLYMNEKHRPWWMACYRTAYGKDMDFSAVGYKSPNYDVPIVWVPGMKNSKFIFLSYEGNLQLLENIPGEMFATYFERRLESVWAMSVWKEGAAAAHAGRKFDTRAALEADKFKSAMIFCNYPVSTFAADDVTPSVAGGNFIFKTSAANTAAKTLTSLDDAIEGEVYKIVYGGGTYATKIAKSGNFDTIASAWEPATEGAWIKLTKVGTKFYEVGRSA